MGQPNSHRRSGIAIGRSILGWIAVLSYTSCIQEPRIFPRDSEVRGRRKHLWQQSPLDKAGRAGNGGNGQEETDDSRCCNGLKAQECGALPGSVWTKGGRGERRSKKESTGVGADGDYRFTTTQQTSKGSGARLGASNSISAKRRWSRKRAR